MKSEIETKLRAITAIHFDGDGVIVDSKHFNAAPFLEPALQVALPSVGQPNIYEPGMLESFSSRGIATFEQDRGIPSGRLWREFMSTLKGMVKSHVRPIDGSTEFLATARTSGLFISLVTFASELEQTIVFRALGITKEDFFRFAITKDDVEKPKPDGECYDKAIKMAAILGIESEQSLIIEDSVRGVTAAKAAMDKRNEKRGLICGLLTSESEESLMEAGADFCMPGFAELRKAIWSQ